MFKDRNLDRAGRKGITANTVQYGFVFLLFFFFFLHNLIHHNKIERQLFSFTVKMGVKSVRFLELRVGNLGQTTGERL